MDRKENKERKLPAFCITSDELAILISKISNVFDPNSIIHAIIEFNVGKTTFKFESSDEIVNLMT